jgi:hypothetical protein
MSYEFHFTLKKKTKDGDAMRYVIKSFDDVVGIEKFIYTDKDITHIGFKKLSEYRSIKGKHLYRQIMAIKKDSFWDIAMGLHHEQETYNRARALESVVHERQSPS